MLRSGQPRTGGVDAGGHQACLASVFASLFLEVGCGADEQGAAVGTAEHAGEYAGAGRDFFGYLAAVAHPDDPAAEAVGYPHRPVRVQAAAVGGDDDLGEHLRELAVARLFPELRPGAAVGQGAVRGDVERGDAVTEGLVHQQRAVLGDHAAVGEPHVLGGLGDGPVGIDAQQAGRLEVGTAHEVEAELADEDPAPGVDHHVVQKPAEVARQVGVTGQGAVGFAAQQAAVAHGDDQQAAVREPAEPRGLLGNLGLGPQVAAVLGRRVHAVGIEVGEPDPLVMPAGPFQVGHARDDGADLAAHSSSSGRVYGGLPAGRVEKALQLTPDIGSARLEDDLGDTAGAVVLEGLPDLVAGSAQGDVPERAAAASTPAGFVGGV